MPLTKKMCTKNCSIDIQVTEMVIISKLVFFGISIITLIIWCLSIQWFLYKIPLNNNIAIGTESPISCRRPHNNCDVETLPTENSNEHNKCCRGRWNSYTGCDSIHWYCYLFFDINSISAYCWSLEIMHQWFHNEIY